MATGKSGSFTFQDASKYFTWRVEWAETYDIETNSSTVRVTGIYIQSRSYTNSLGTWWANAVLKINGVTVCEMNVKTPTHYIHGMYDVNKDCELTAYGSGTPKDKWVSAPIVHNSDGTKSITISIEYNPANSGSIYLYRDSNPLTVTFGAVQSSTIQLTTIPRASSITSVGAVTLGKACNVKWTPMSKSFSYKLKFSLGGWSYTTNAIIPNTTAAYTYTGYVIPMEVANQITGSPNGTMTVELYTYSASGEQIGNADSKKVTATVPDNQDTRPDVSLNLAPVSELEVPFNELYIQNLTRVSSDITADGKYGASIDLLQMVIGGSVYGEPYVSSYISQTGDVAVTAKAIDSRGYVGQAQQTIHVIPYAKPAIIPAEGEIGIVCVRCDEAGNIGSGTSLKIKAKRSYSHVISNGEQLNFCQFRYRCNGGGWVTIPADGDEIDTVIPGVVVSTTTAYTIEVGVVDTLGYDSSAIIIVPSDHVDFHLREGGYGAAFGEYAQDANVVAVAENWELKVKGRATVSGSNVVTDATLIDKVYPVGSVYMSINNVNPAAFLGGAWEQIDGLTVYAWKRTN